MKPKNIAKPERRDRKEAWSSEVIGRRHDQQMGWRKTLKKPRKLQRDSKRVKNRTFLVTTTIQGANFEGVRPQQNQWVVSVEGAKPLEMQEKLGK